jgi:hypothetical protein
MKATTGKTIIAVVPGTGLSGWSESTDSVSSDSSVGASHSAHTAVVAGFDPVGGVHEPVGERGQPLGIVRGSPRGSPGGKADRVETSDFPV